ncbi:glycoside hydrolase family 12 protein [Xylariaceae sp. FL1019]|nr:glycoside hydrolase family 12 protein [Xylariaceae sp. FL1019]
MLSLLVGALLLSPLATGAPHRHHRPCSGGHHTTKTVTEIVTASDSVSESTVSPNSSVLTTSSIPETSSVAETSSEGPVSTTVIAITVSPIPESSVVEQPSSTSASAQAVTTSSSSSKIPTPSSTSTSAKAVATSASSSEIPTSTPSSSPTVAGDSVYAVASAISYKIGATTQCGDEDRLIMPGMPWTVSNAMYGADQMVGTQCTNFKQLLEATDGTDLVQWTSTTDIELIEDTEGICKGYSNVGIGANLQYPLRDIKSIPAYYSWNRTIESEFRGSNLFDFVVAPTAGDGTSTATSEFMLFLKVWGGQIPIGYSRGPVATLDLYGTTWSLYEGVNPGSGVTVRSAIADNQFEGEFEGDLKEWLDEMVNLGYIEDTQFVNVGNGGTEIFYGKSTQDVKTALNINV